MTHPLPATSSLHLPLALPAWAQVGERRHAHIVRVTALLDEWSASLGLAAAERQAWHDAGAWHDALRDAPTEELRRLTDHDARPVNILHGPAAAARLELHGERRTDVIEAVRWHTLGNPEWGPVGRALFMADFLEPARPFMQNDRTFLAQHVMHDVDGVFRQVVRMRVEWTLREGKEVFPETIALWNRVR